MLSNLNKLLNTLFEKSELQKKKVERFINSKNDDFKEEFELFLKDYIGYLKKNNLSIEYALDSYLEMISDMFKCQVKFMRTGKYPQSQVSEAIRDVYNNEHKMLSYMIGLALSQYLWSTHYEMFCHLKSSLSQNKSTIKKYLEIGPGHGLFLKSAIDILGKNTEMVAVDISPTSLNISKSILNHFYPSKIITFINKDMLALESNKKYDFIVMGEVIEHVEEPDALLIKISQLLSKKGKAFISTCVNCPMIDHVYHFRHVEEIRVMLNSCGLTVENEKILPVEDLSMKEIIENKITINYSCIVKKTAKNV